MLNVDSPNHGLLTVSPAEAFVLSPTGYLCPHRHHSITQLRCNAMTLICLNISLTSLQYNFIQIGDQTNLEYLLTCNYN